MHPILRSRTRLATYLAAWGLLGVLGAAVANQDAPGTFRAMLLLTVPVALAYGFVCLSAWWVCRAAPLARTAPLRIGMVFVAAAVAASICLAVLATLWSQAIAALGPHPGVPPASSLSTRLCFALGVPLYLFSVAIHYLIAVFEDSRRAERRALESQVVAREAELRALRAQLDPHFLFNSLNSINALVGSDPEAARRMCAELGEFLRLTLALGARDAVSLGEELDLVEKYLGIEHVRFGQRLTVRVQVAPELRDILVPPLLLQPLVENAVKHGIASRLEGGTIDIRAERHENALAIEVSNPTDADEVVPAGTGVGLENVRRRLRAFDPRHTSLVATRSPELFKVVLTLAASDSKAEVRA